MKKQMKIAFLGGDRRQHTAAVKLSRDGWDIYVWGQDISSEEKGISPCDNIYEAICDAAVIVLPLPASSDGISLNTSCATDSGKVALSVIIDAAPQDCIIIGGRLGDSFFDLALSRGIKCFDYFDSEVFQIQNAYTTAEAALSIAMDRLDKNIRDSRFAITGYGRIARQLARLLRCFGARVSVCARKDSDLTWARLEGCQTCKIGEKGSTDSLLEGYDVIFNTVPRWLFDEEFLVRVNKNTLMIELASAPGGIDVSAAKRLHSNVLWAASLPGKYAPQSAGELIAECVGGLIEREVGAR